MSLLKAPAVAGAVLVAVLSVASFGWNWSRCHLYGWDLDRQVRYSGFTGCLVRMPTGWTSKAELRTEQ